VVGGFGVFSAGVGGRGNGRAQRSETVRQKAYADVLAQRVRPLDGIVASAGREEKGIKVFRVPNIKSPLYITTH